MAILWSLCRKTTTFWREVRTMAIILRLPQVCSSLLWVRMLAHTALPRSLTLFSLSRRAALPPDPSQAAVTRTHTRTHACTRRGEQGGSEVGRERGRDGRPEGGREVGRRAHSLWHALGFSSHARTTSKPGCRSAPTSSPTSPPPASSRHAHAGQTAPDETRHTHFLLHADM